MRGFLLTATLAAVACSGIHEGAVHAPDTPGDTMDVAGKPGTDPGSQDAYAGEGPQPDAPATDDRVVADDSAAPDDGLVQDEGFDPSGEIVTPDADVLDAETPDTEVPPGTLRHFGWFGPGGVVTGNGLSGLGSLSGPRQAWQAKQAVSYVSCSNISRGRRDCRMMDWSVPMRSSAWSGTGTVMVVPATRFCITTWLPRRRTSTKPWPESSAQTSFPEKTRSLPNRDLQAGDEDLGVQSVLHLARFRALEEEPEGLDEVGARLLDGGALARDVQLRAKGNVSVALALDDPGQLADHGCLAWGFTPLSSSNPLLRLGSRPSMDDRATERLESESVGIEDRRWS